MFDQLPATKGDIDMLSKRLSNLAEIVGDLKASISALNAEFELFTGKDRLVPHTPEEKQP